VSVHHDGEPAGSDGRNRIEGAIVVDASFMGVSTQYLIRTPWGQELMVFEQNRGTAKLYRPGDAVSLSWSSEHTFALDAGQAADAGIELDGEAAS
jgi:spermidine/putrescine transport system ATP-binding protein